MGRLPAVAIGVALCALATTGADAQSSRMRLGTYGDYRWHADGTWERARPHARRRPTRAGKRRGAPHRTGRRHAARSAHRGRAARRTGVRGRGIVTFARGGISRTCLTPAARRLLDRIEAQFGPVRIVSTCRPGAVIAGTRRPSRHASGNAIDFNAPSGRKPEVVRWLIANHRSGGVMTYVDMSHIHVDIGRRFVSLAAHSRGRRSASRLTLQRP